MLSTLAVRGYRSLRDLTLPLGRLTVVSGANGTGKSSLYRALRLLADCGRGEVIGSLAREGGLESALWAGPEQLGDARRSGAAQGSVRTRPVSLEMGFASDDFGYLVDLGLPQDPEQSSAFAHDPEIKREIVFAGPVPRRGATLVSRTRAFAQASADSGVEELSRTLPTYRSVLSEFAHSAANPELAAVRDRLRDWRFYDGFRVDASAPVRRPQVGTRTPILAGDGVDLAAAVQTITESGDDELDRAIAAAFDGATLSVSSRDGLFELHLHQRGMLRPLRAAELSDGTLRFLLWSAALTSPQPPSLMVLNEPETSLHPELVAPLAGLIRSAAAQTQVVVITHAPTLRELLDGDTTTAIELVRDFGETRIRGQGLLDAPAWDWGSR